MRWLLVVALVVVACAEPKPSPLPATCDTRQGGRAGAQAQLRFVDVTDSQVVLTFGPSAEPGEFDVPPFQLERLEGTSAPRAYRVHVSGASSVNPDGTTSYNGLPDVEIGTRTVRALHLIDEARRAMTFTVLLERVTCPFVGARSYVYGKSPRAQIVLTFNDAGSLSIETQSDVSGGAEVGTPAQASGMGYSPGSTVKIGLGGREIHETTADTAGAFDTGFWIPEREPGLYAVTASDGRGRVGMTMLRVMVRRPTH